MNATVFPDVTTSRCVFEESSIELIGFSNGSFFVTAPVRRSHHLIARIRFSATQKSHSKKQHSLDDPVLTPTHTGILVKPYNTLDRAVVR